MRRILHRLADWTILGGLIASAVAAVAWWRWGCAAPDVAALARPVRPPVPGEFRGPTVPEVIERHNRRGGPGDVSPADVLEP